MTPNPETSNCLPPECLQVLIVAASARARLTSTELAGLSRWLNDEWKQALRRARTKPLKKSDVDGLENAYRKFCAAIDRLQDRTLPPPRIPTSGGSTAWDDWREMYEQFGYIRGRRESSDWLLIGALLALYEALSGKIASAAQTNGPTMRFLRSALNELSPYAPASLRSNFAPPNAEALKQQIPALNRLALRQAKRGLAKIIRHPGE